jgi:Vam6/Vps39-like protein vacuolar protein sorting-associated protein 39
LNAVAQFKAAKFDEAINTFIELDLNPAKVVALYPEVIAGRLAVPRNGWIVLYGGPDVGDDSSSHSSEESTKEDSQEPPVQPADVSPPTTGTISGKLRTSPGSGIAPESKDDNTAPTPIVSKPKAVVHGQWLRYLRTKTLM